MFFCIIRPKVHTLVDVQLMKFVINCKIRLSIVLSSHLMSLGLLSSDKELKMLAHNIAGLVPYFMNYQKHIS